MKLPHNRLWLLVLYMTFLGGNYMLYVSVLPVRISFHLIATVVLLVCLVKRGLPDSPLTIGAGLMMLAVGLSTMNAIDGRMALENAWHWLVNLLLLLMLIHWVRDGYGPVILKAHFACGLTVAALAVLQHLLSGGRPGGPFLNINLTGAYVAAVSLPLVTSFGPVKIPSTRFAQLLAAALLLMAALLVSENRGGLLSVGVAVLVYLLFMWRGRPVRQLALVAAVVGVLLPVLVLMSTIPKHADGDVIRMDLWRAGGDMLTTYPTGVGPGLFAQEYRLIGASGQNQFSGAHNTYINLGAELGAIGLAAGAVLFLIGLYYLIGEDLTARQIAILAALAGVAAHMAFDNYPANNWAFLLATYAALLLYKPKLIPRGAPLQIASAFTALVLLAFGVLLAHYDRAQIAYETSLWSGRYYDAYDAYTLDRDNRLYSLQLLRLRNDDLTQIDPSIQAGEDLTMYGVTNFGRLFR